MCQKSDEFLYMSKKYMYVKINFLLSLYILIKL